MVLRTLASAGLLAGLTAAVLFAQPKGPTGDYVKKATRAETVVATLASHKLPNLVGKWFVAGPFDNSDRQGFETAYGPEKGAVDLKATYPGKGGASVKWAEFKGFQLGQVLNLAALFPPEHRNNSVAYLYHEFDSDREFRLPLSLGSDDTLSVFFNGRRLLHEHHERPAAPDQDRVELPVVVGKNRLLIKVCQYGGGWEAYVAPELPQIVPETIRRRADRDFPGRGVVEASQAAATAEANHYAVSTIPLPDDCVLEVGGLAFRPDGKLLACTRRGEIWLVHNPLAADPKDVKVTRFATGLHEALGMWVQDDKTVYVVHRPELCKVTDTDGDGVADEFETVCDKWGVSGDYHEYAFGPARDKDGNFYITLNVGFGGGHQAKSPWRGWCVKVDPRTGAMEPWAYGVRSPNGINFDPDGELFYADNQGEWVATNKLHHLKRGQFYGHQAGLRWLPFSPFAGLVSTTVASGMLYDGQRGPGANAPSGMPQLDPPVIWFPYGRMGKSVSEPIWDTTRGRFGPFAGQCLVGDQSTSVVMRVAMEKVNGVFQGACFPFRAGFQCGVNRLVFAPDGSLFVGETNRGWGSLGGKPYGLQRVTYTGVEPFEIHHVTLTRTGFDVVFTKPVDPAAAAAAVPVESYTYVYSSAYGCPETDRRSEQVTGARLSADGKTLSLDVPGLRPGRVYALRPDAIRTAAGEKLLHPEAYYTLNQLVRGPAAARGGAALAPPRAASSMDPFGPLDLAFTDPGHPFHLHHMELALAEAAAAAAADEVPVGAVVIHPQRGVIAAAHNQREELHDPTAHAEMIAITQAAAALRSWRLEGCILYVTLEPCPMCAGAVVQARLPLVVYGCTDPKAGACHTLYQIPTDARLNHRARVIGGVMADRCAAVLTQFFVRKRALGKK